MKRIAIFGGAMCAAVALGGPAAGDGTKPPTEVAGISLGANVSIVDAKCKEPGVTCKRTKRKVKSGVVTRVVLTRADGGFSRVVVSIKDDMVLGVRGAYRTRDASRVDVFRRAFGKGKVAGNAVGWNFPAGTSAVFARNGAWVQIVDSQRARACGIDAKPLADRARPHVAIAAPAPAAPHGEKIKANLVLDRLEIYDENDEFSIIWGDAPYIKVVGMHTTPLYAVPEQWEQSFGHMESDESHPWRAIGRPVFGENDARHTVASGEAVGFQVTLYEGDTVSSDDEIDYVYAYYDFDRLRESKGSRIDGEGTFWSIGTRYKVKWHVDVGTPESATQAPSHFRSVRPASYAGDYVGVIGDTTGPVKLDYVAATPEHPEGSFTGTWMAGGRGVQSVVTERLSGNSVVLRLEMRGVPSVRLFGYLSGGDKLVIAGTTLRDADIGGFSFKKK